VAVDDLAQQQSTTIAELRHELAELMPGIGHGQWLDARQRLVAGKDLRPAFHGAHFRVESQLQGEGAVQSDQAGLRYRNRGLTRVEMSRKTCVGIVECGEACSCARHLSLLLVSRPLSGLDDSVGVFGRLLWVQAGEVREVGA
jgi:hypothetical protein